MTSQQKFRVAFIAIISIITCVILAPTFFRGQLPEGWPSRPMRLGLDLKGGTYLVLEVKTDEAVKSQLNSIAGSIKSEMRKQAAGVLRSRVSGERSIEVSLLNERGLETVRRYVRDQYPLLGDPLEGQEGTQVKLTYTMKEERAKEIKQLAVEQAVETIRSRIDQFGVAEPTIQRAGENQIIVQLPEITNAARVRETIGKLAKLEFRLVSQGQEGKTFPMKGGGTLLLEDEVQLTGDAIEKATVDIDPQTGAIEVALKFNATGAREFARVTGEHVGRQLAIVLDGEVHSAPNINERIGGGNAQITGSFSTEEARQLAIVLRSGALPAPLETLDVRTVGASLGADAVRKGFNATVMGGVLVVAFMTLYYRRSGLLAIGSLTLNILLLMALLVLFNATLTLPGIAGFGLTIGMAVDSNIIIYERIRDELKNGAAIRAAIDAGFHKAHWTILDANITTLLSGIILYTFGSGPIRGFAVTLSIGVLTTIFAALFVSRVGFDIFSLRNRKGELSI